MKDKTGHTRSWKQLLKFFRTLKATGNVKLSGSVSRIPPETLRRYMTPEASNGNKVNGFSVRFMGLASYTRARWVSGLVAKLQGGGLRGRDGLGLQWLLEQHAPDLYNSSPVSGSSPALQLIQILKGSPADAGTIPGIQSGAQKLVNGAKSQPTQTEPPLPASAGVGEPGSMKSC